MNPLCPDSSTPPRCTGGDDMVPTTAQWWTNWAVDALPGAAQGFVGVLVGHPLDTVKTRMQTDYYHHCNNNNTAQLQHQHSSAAFQQRLDASSRPSFLSVGSRMVREEGPRSLYRGFAPPLLTMTVKRGVQMSMFASLQNRSWAPQQLQKNGNVSADHRNWLGALQPFVSGACAGAGGTVVGCPMHVLKIQTQNVPRDVTRNAWDCLVHILRTDGPKGLYRGLPHHVVKDSLFGSCYLGLYTTCKRALSEYVASARNSADAIQAEDLRRVSQQSQHRQRLLVGFLSGSVASSVTWTLLYPIDSVKTRIQAKGAASAREALRSGGGSGVRWLYRGLGAALVRAGPVNGCSMLAYEGAHLALGART